MSKVIAITNQKGGVGKTTTTVDLGAALSRENKKVLLVDFDPQGNLTSGLGIDRKRPFTVLNLLQSEVMGMPYDVHEAIETHETDEVKMDVLPANKLLVSAEAIFNSFDGEKELILKNVLTKVEDDYDYVLIDCPPSLSLLTINALGAANSVLIPMQPAKYSLDGLADLIKLVMMAQNSFNTELEFEGIVYTLDTPNQVEARNIKQDVENAYGANVRIHETFIPRLKDISSSPSYGVSVFDFAPSSKGAMAYANLAKEVLANA